jgi:hypothetical protein
MKTTLTTSQAAHMLANDENSSFSLPGAYALVEYLEQLEEDAGEDMEFCTVAIRCDYSEHESLMDWWRDYFGTGMTLEDTVGAEPDAEDIEVEHAIREYIQDHGQLIEFDGGIIVSSF